MGFFDGLGKHLKPGRRGSGMGFDGLAAEADATRIRLSDHVHKNVSRVPPSTADEADDGPEGEPMPAEKPDPRAQWDDVRAVWILWDPDQGAWVDLDG